MAINSNMSGVGILPVGVYKLAVVSFDTASGDVVFLHTARGTHVEQLSTPLPLFTLSKGMEVEVKIGLSEGCYARRNNKGEYALHDSKSHTRLTEWNKDIWKIMNKDLTLATTVVEEIKYNEEVWKRNG